MADHIVETTAGLVAGTPGEGHVRFLGIPYAEPPIGLGRFAPAVPASPWVGTFEATGFAAHAPQPPSLMEAATGTTDVRIDEATCLGLNVWTPAADAGRRPVMVWIHGGAFVFGSASSPWYDGTGFAVDHDVVLVSLNYRLGALGFTHLGDVGGDPASGSLGVLDAALALRWVRDNIAAFGGDPGNVTIFGESAGAMSVGTLLGLPAARGLFHKAILQSGAASNVRDGATAAAHAAELCELAGAHDVEALRALPVAAILDAQVRLGAAHAGDGVLVHSPVVDGAVLDRPPLEAVAAGAVADVPLLVGTNLDEWHLFSLQSGALSTDAAQLRAVLARMGDPDELEALYRRRLGAGAAPWQVLSAAHTDIGFRLPAARLAEAQISAGGTVFTYLWTWPSPAGGGLLGACHALELPFVFNTLGAAGADGFTGGQGPAQLATTVHASWAAFARHGDPSSGPLGDWPAHDLVDRPTMVLDEPCRLEHDPLADERLHWAR